MLLVQVVDRAVRYEAPAHIDAVRQQRCSRAVELWRTPRIQCVRARTDNFLNNL